MALVTVIKDRTGVVGEETPPNQTDRNDDCAKFIPDRGVGIGNGLLCLGRLTNLLINAAKFTNPGGHIRLTVTDEFGEIVVRVQDNGRGIAQDLLPRVFDLHSQAPDGGARRPGGLGLGLALVKSLVELHSGRVTGASSGPGADSEFIVRLPTRARAA